MGWAEWIPLRRRIGLWIGEGSVPLIQSLIRFMPFNMISVNNWRIRLVSWRMKSKDIPKINLWITESKLELKSNWMKLWMKSRN
jgi:hypothetical protein